jgi:hypothetical protein
MDAAGPELKKWEDKLSALQSSANSLVSHSPSVLSEGCIRGEHIHSSVVQHFRSPTVHADRIEQGNITGGKIDGSLEQTFGDDD